MDKSNKSDIFLSEQEKTNLKNLNNKSNMLNNINRETNDPINMSIKELFYKWSSANIQIFTDIVRFISNINEYTKYFDDIDETGQWYNGIILILRNLLKIFTKDNRPIFIGFTFILLSFALYLIQITS